MGMNILRTAVRHRDTALHQRGVHSHLTTKPRMPRIADFSDFTNMGVVLLTCIMAIERTQGWEDVCQNRVVTGSASPIGLDSYQWRRHCRGSYQTPMAA